jgi:hypothetical protein
MRSWAAVLFLSVAALAGEPKEPRSSYSAAYEGGTLSLTRNKVKATLGADRVMITQGRRVVSVRARDIVRISYGNNIRRRFGAAVLDFVPLVRWGEAETLYIGLTWNGPGGAPQAEALFRVDRGDYQPLLAALERLTGLKAVDTRQVPTVVRYRL